jgi:hypothetical protein
MGYWTQNKQGHSFATNDGEEMTWGDAPADAVDNALDAITRAFATDLGRFPTRKEIEAGIQFSLAGQRLPETTAEAAEHRLTESQMDAIGLGGKTAVDMIEALEQHFADPYAREEAPSPT